MNLTSDIEVANTRKKLAELESRHEELQNSEEYDKRLRELTMRSLKRLINQLKEEIIRYEVASRSYISSHANGPVRRAPTA